jgi:hypothetical protein
MKKSALEVRFQTFIGLASRRGATKEELCILIKAIDLIRKYNIPTNNEES